jgi:multicomponent Na+:H+ antiporter subunit E
MVYTTPNKKIFFLSLLRRLLLATFIWWLITEGQVTSWIIGAPAVLLAVAFSFYLKPAQAMKLSLPGLLTFWWYFSRQSLTAGVDVAKRILSPDMPLLPGEIRIKVYLPEGPPRWLLAMTLSLLPGTLSVRYGKNDLLLHCLDISQSVESDVFVAQRKVAAVFGLPLAELLQQEQQQKRAQT